MIYSNFSGSCMALPNSSGLVNREGSTLTSSFFSVPNISFSNSSFVLNSSLSVASVIVPTNTPSI